MGVPEKVLLAVMVISRAGTGARPYDTVRVSGLLKEWPDFLIQA